MTRSDRLDLETADYRKLIDRQMRDTDRVPRRTLASVVFAGVSYVTSLAALVFGAAVVWGVFTVEDREAWFDSVLVSVSEVWHGMVSFVQQNPGWAVLIFAVIGFINRAGDLAQQRLRCPAWVPRIRRSRRWLNPQLPEVAPRRSDWHKPPPGSEAPPRPGPRPVYNPAPRPAKEIETTD